MMYKILMFDGRPVQQVFYDRIVYCDPNCPRLRPYDLTMDKLLNEPMYKEPWESKRKALLRKCELEEIELRFTKQI